MSVQLTDENFNFDNLRLMPPVGVQGGAYFSKLKYGNDRLIIQTPKCGTKNGIKKTGKKSYCDLMFSNEEIDFLDWSETFEDKIKDLIFSNKESWFHDDLEKDDIEYNWNSSLRSYKSKFHLFRTYIEKSKVLNSEPKLQIFNEDQERLTLADINVDSNMICILEIKGLKFTSQSFHLECSLVQIMVLAESEKEEGCLIKFSNKKRNLEKKVNIITTPVHENNLEEEPLEEEPIVAEEPQKEEVHVEEEEQEPNLELQDNLEEQVEQKESKDLVENLEDDTLEESENLPKEEINLETVDTNKKTEVLDNINDETIDLEKSDSILEVNLELPDDLEINSMKLKKPNEVYIEMYEQALKKAKLAKRLAIEAYLESKEIKKTYMLDINEYLDDDLEKMIETESKDENKLIK